MERRPFPTSVLKKAERLIRNKSVSKISDGVYSVKSQHPERLRTYPMYMVSKSMKGSWTCSCKGFDKRGICSHSIAVMMTESKSIK